MTIFDREYPSPIENEALTLAREARMAFIKQGYSATMSAFSIAFAETAPNSIAAPALNDLAPADQRGGSQSVTDDHQTDFRSPANTGTTSGNAQLVYLDEARKRVESVEDNDSPHSLADYLRYHNAA
jgi:hypothetical protein